MTGLATAINAHQAHLQRVIDELYRIAGSGEAAGDMAIASWLRAGFSFSISHFDLPRVCDDLREATQMEVFTRKSGSIRHIDESSIVLVVQLKHREVT
jgi:hypothetical protein